MTKFGTEFKNIEMHLPSTKNYASFAFCKKCGTAKEIKEIN